MKNIESLLLKMNWEILIFIKNFKNLEIENFFKENDGNNKIVFAQKYIENTCF